MDTLKPQNVDQYIAMAAPNVKTCLEQLRIAISIAAPDAEECISYQMPAYRQQGILVYFGGFAKHVSLFPGSEAISFFKDELHAYKTSTGTIQFAPDKPLPTDLIKKIVKFRLKKNLEKCKKQPKNHK